MFVVVYFNGGREVAACPPSPAPDDGEFTTWYSGEGDTEAEARLDALAAADWEAEVLR